MAPAALWNGVMLVGWRTARVVLLAAFCGLAADVLAANPAPESRPESPVERRAEIALIIDDLGWDLLTTVEIADLPGPLTLAFLPYPEGLPEQVQVARRAGHEVIVHMPMEPISPVEDAGRMALRVLLGAAEIGRRLAWAIGRVPGAIGMNNHMGSRFTKNCAGMAVVFEAIARRGLVYIDSRTTGASVGRPLAGSIGVAFAQRDVFLDHDRDYPAIEAALVELERVAFMRGWAIGIGHPDPNTIAALQKWLPDVVERGFRIVRASGLADVPAPARKFARLNAPPRDAGRLNSPPRDAGRLNSPPRDARRLNSPPRDARRCQDRSVSAR